MPPTDSNSTATREQRLSSSVNLLGRLLGEIILQAHGEWGFNTVENLRRIAKQGGDDDKERRNKALEQQIKNLVPEQMLLVARAFSQFLNLTNIAEQLYETIDADELESQDVEFLDRQLGAQGVDQSLLLREIQNLHLDLVLTAHPTEITRRTLIEKQNKIYDCLEQLETRRLSAAKQKKIHRRLRDLIAQWWHTDEFREHKPTPVDEAVWGFAVVENSLWEAVPLYIRNVVEAVQKQCAVTLPVEFAPIRFSSWMGGDRDGNPNVTVAVTEEVIRLARWKAADLFLKDIHQLISELSMNACSETLRRQVGEAREPYRVILKRLRTLLQNTLQCMDDLLKGREPGDAAIIKNSQQLWQPLHDCYQSLCACGMEIIANGNLLDTLRRVRCFGNYLLRLDIRQESGRHAQVFAELTRELFGQYNSELNYAQWSEAQRCEFLLHELENKRPLIPRHWQPSAEVKEVLDTFALIAEQPRDALGAYVISMAKAPSDVLAVQLLLKEFDCSNLPIAPLFETLEDLNNAPSIVLQLLKTPVYRQRIDGKQMIMIGYSDSSKDAGVMAASWAQYRAQEALLKVCLQCDVQLTLFHGRGGTTGRGGAPAHAALMSQPPGTLQNGLRVTEQGEMIRFKLGTPDKAVKTFALYTTAMLRSNLMPPPEPKNDWRHIMDRLSDISAKAYRNLVFETNEFLDYFKSATPIAELGTLPLGSRPARRDSGKQDGVESLRAIPWSFSWSQNRLMLPAWYGAGEALEQLVADGQKQTLEAMCRQWPFFSTRISLLEMVYAKADIDISAHYEQRLVESNLQQLGQRLRERVRADISLILSIANDESLLQDLPSLKHSLSLRNTYIDPLNMLQVELLARTREAAEQDVSLGSESEKALMVTVAGIAAGLRNTG